MKPEELVQALRRCSCQAESRGCEACPLYSNNDCVTYALSGAADLIERLRELAAADKDGRVVVLPCKVGEPAYWVHNGIITDCRINRIQVNRKGVFLCLKSIKSHGAFRADVCLGETVFLTREEAEKALAENGGNDNG